MRKKIGFPVRKKGRRTKNSASAPLCRFAYPPVREHFTSGRQERPAAAPPVQPSTRRRLFPKHCPQRRLGKTSSFRPARAMPSSPSPVNAFQTVRHVVAVSGGRNDHFDRSATLIARSTHRPLRSVVLSRLQLSVSVERKICLYFDIITVIDSLSIVTKKANGKNISVTANAYTDTQKPTAQSAVGC